MNLGWGSAEVTVLSVRKVWLHLRFRFMRLSMLGTGLG